MIAGFVETWRSKNVDQFIGGCVNPPSSLTSTMCLHAGFCHDLSHNLVGTLTHVHQSDKNLPCGGFVSILACGFGPQVYDLFRSELPRCAIHNLVVGVEVDNVGEPACAIRK